MHFLSFSVAFLLTAVSLVSALPAREVDTNAQRLARGLPPLPPKRLYQPARAEDAPVAKRSTSPAPVAGDVGYFTCDSIFGGLYATCCETATTVGIYDPTTGDLTGVQPTTCYIDTDMINPNDEYAGDCTDVTAADPNISGYTGYCCTTAAGGPGATAPVNYPLLAIGTPGAGACILSCEIYDTC